MANPHWRRAMHASMLGHPPFSPWWRPGLTALWLASQVYRGLLAGRRGCYAAGLYRQRRLPCRVVSIGNLTLGGTGKTPLTIWIARWYQQQGWRVAVLSRGYGARTTAHMQVVSVGDGPLMDWQTVGDEPYLFACALPGASVVIGKDRYRSGHYAVTQLGAQVLLLDDGFQHDALYRDLDVVLIDASNPFGHGSLLPRGILREPLWALQRAHAIVLTRVDMASDTRQALCHDLRQRHPQAPLYALRTVSTALYQHDTEHELSLLRQQRVVAFAGIGNPQAFATTVAQCGGDVVALLAFPDHHAYTLGDWEDIVGIVRQRHATCLVTTEKDAIRLAPFWQASVPVYTLRIDVAFEPTVAPFYHQLQALHHA